MDEGRKRVLLIAASILAARKLAQYEPGARVPATISAIADAVRWAEEIVQAIDERFPERRQTQPGQSTAREKRAVGRITRCHCILSLLGQSQSSVSLTDVCLISARKKL